MGLGHFGGGVAVARWLALQGARVTVTDAAPEAKLTESLAQLEGLPIRYRLGGHDPADLEGCELLVISPAVPKDRSEFVRTARERGIPISSEMNLFVERCRARRIVGITGSAGKSTTTAMLGAIAARAFPGGSRPGAWVGGNIGRSLLPDLEQIRHEDVVILELSSFQLEDLAALRWSPHIALITNIQPNHLDRHGTLEAYADAKLNIVRYQRPGDVVLVHERDEALADRVRAVGAASRLERYRFDAAFADVIRVPGPHNRDNAAGAIAAARALGVSDAAIRAGLAGFTGLPHRLELVGEHAGVRYFNDSKSTTPESSIIALEAFEEPVIMLVGGRDKGAPFDAMSRRMAERARAVVAYGETREIFAQQVRAFAAEIGRDVPVRTATDFRAAVESARDLASAGDVVVLSPACTSYDMFSNYEERGDRFREIVRSLGGT